MTTRELAAMYRAEGMSYSEIAKKIGVSYQRVAQILGKKDDRYFYPIEGEACVYPNLAAWMNEHRVSRMEFIRKMGYAASPATSMRLSDIMKGKIYPRKPFIDLMLKVTGMKYEELFATGA